MYEKYHRSCYNTKTLKHKILEHNSVMTWVEITLASLKTTPESDLKDENLKKKKKQSKSTSYENILIRGSKDNTS